MIERKKISSHRCDLQVVLQHHAFIIVLFSLYKCKNICLVSPCVNFVCAARVCVGGGTVGGTHIHCFLVLKMWLAKSYSRASGRISLSNTYSDEE